MAGDQLAFTIHRVCLLIRERWFLGFSATEVRRRGEIVHELSSLDPTIDHWLRENGRIGWGARPMQIATVHLRGTD